MLTKVGKRYVSHWFSLDQAGSFTQEQETPLDILLFLQMADRVLLTNFKHTSDLETTQTPINSSRMAN